MKKDYPIYYDKRVKKQKQLNTIIIIKQKQIILKTTINI